MVLREWMYKLGAASPLEMCFECDYSVECTSGSTSRDVFPYGLPILFYGKRKAYLAVEKRQCQRQCQRQCIGGHRVRHCARRPGRRSGGFPGARPIRRRMRGPGGPATPPGTPPATRRARGVVEAEALALRAAPRRIRGSAREGVSTKK